MLKKTANFLRGSITLRIVSPFPERVLNVCSAQNIEFWNIAWRGREEISVTIHRRDRSRFRAALEPLDARAEIERETGVPRFLGRFRRRHALLAGLALCALMLIVNSFFIWDFEVSGNETVRTEKILRVLADNGVHRGTFVFSFRPKDICNRTLPEIPELAWLTVTVRGCRAYVQVRERVPMPELANDTAPTNVIARRASLVTEVRALDGEKKVMKGTTVLPGQLLISGAVDTQGPEHPSVSSRFLAGRGEVWGRTWYELSTRIPLQKTERGGVLGKKYAFSVILNEKHFKIGAKECSHIGANCDKIVSRTELSLPGGFLLPLALERETTVFYEETHSLRSRAEAFEQGKALAHAYLLSQIDGTVTSERYADAVQGDWLLVTLSAECLEQIGKTVPIEMEK